MKELLEGLKSRFPEAITSAYTSPRGDDYLVVKPESLPEVARCLRDEHHFTLYIDTCGIDRLLLPENDPRFEVICTVRQGQAPWKKLHLKAFVAEASPELPSLAGVWKGADWWERYTFDMYGIRFTGHPDLRRILLYEEFQGHPLRKDFPLRGRQPLVAERNFQDLTRGPGAQLPVAESK